MAIEIERKFLVSNDAWRQEAKESHLMRQGYVVGTRGASVRVRVTDEGAFVTLKGRKEGLSRSEFEYAIPLADGEEMLETLCSGGIIEKVRYRVPFGGRTWEVDEFRGVNEGLVVAEIEIEAETAVVELPPWVGQEVSDDPRYFNAALSTTPFSEWDD